ncbi:MAG: DUF2207 domain-containing protein, partial [Anaerolineales bacterium]|nr:DUF2207 domain-containing protein [Anaerolineales bacterium]
SVPLLIYAAMYSLLTPAGEEQKMRWKSFRNYLNQVCRGREPAMRPDLFERYLAYAAVFGLGEEWARYFQKLGGVPLPVWFRSLSGDFDSMIPLMSAADTSASSSGGDGGGASGGGASGAG